VLQKVILAPNVCSYKNGFNFLSYLWTIWEVWPELAYMLVTKKNKKRHFCSNCFFSLKFLRYAVRTLSHDILLYVVFTNTYFSGKWIFLKTVLSVPEIKQVDPAHIPLPTKNKDNKIINTISNCDFRRQRNMRLLITSW
jgi:hypothetical protein